MALLELTEEQLLQTRSRYTTYKSLLDFYVRATNENISSNRRGFCYILSKMFGIDTYGDDEFKLTLPELFAMKPENVYRDGLANYWYAPHDSLSRVRLLEKLIHSLKQAIYTEKAALLDQHGILGGGTAVNGQHDKLNGLLVALGVDPNS